MGRCLCGSNLRWAKKQEREMRLCVDNERMMMMISTHSRRRIGLYNERSSSPQDGEEVVGRVGIMSPGNRTGFAACSRGIHAEPYLLHSRETSSWIYFYGESTSPYAAPSHKLHDLPITSPSDPICFHRIPTNTPTTISYYYTHIDTYHQ